MSFFIRKDTRRDTIKADKALVMPIVPGNVFPPNIEEAIGGGLIYNSTTKLPYYNDGTQWLPFGSGGGGGNVQTYSLRLYDPESENPIPIPDNTDTILAPWGSTPVPWHDNTSSWNTTTGIYTASTPSSLMIAANVTWQTSPSSTLGIRHLQIMYKTPSDPPVVIKEAVTQPDPDEDIATTQEATIVLKLNTGDQAWIQLRQDSGLEQYITQGIETTIAGFKSS